MIKEKDKKNKNRFISIFIIWLIVLMGFVGVILESDSIIGRENNPIGVYNTNTKSRGYTIISSNTTWTLTNSPYYIEGNIWVQNNLPN